jgi:hypothetical protein
MTSFSLEIMKTELKMWGFITLEATGCKWETSRLLLS